MWRIVAGRVFPVDVEFQQMINLFNPDYIRPSTTHFAHLVPSVLCLLSFATKSKLPHARFKKKKENYPIK